MRGSSTKATGPTRGVSPYPAGETELEGGASRKARLLNRRLACDGNGSCPRERANFYGVMSSLPTHRAQADAFVAVARFLPKLVPREPSLFAGARASAGWASGRPDASLPSDAGMAEAEGAKPAVRALDSGSAGHVSILASVFPGSYGSPG